MLDPQNRTLLHDALEPPNGYDLGHALGTTYSLELSALMSVPLAFTRYHRQEAGQEGEDLVETLESLQRFADQMTVFCQSGRIRSTTESKELFQLLEDIVVEVNLPGESQAFHPKIWLLRFTSENARPHYRLLCLSRNVTYARSWDTLLRLDGEFRDDRQYAFARNYPLRDFIQALPEMATWELDTERRSEIDTMIAELPRVDFEPPDDVEEFGFHPFGIDDREDWPFNGSESEPKLGSSRTVVSPFVSGDLLERFTSESCDATLISRVEELDKLELDTLESFDRVYTLNPAVELNPANDSIELEDEQRSTEESADNIPRSLHAKVFIDEGRETRVFTGSANATNAAFNQNVEFLVELQGRTEQLGRKAFLGRDVDQNEEAIDNPDRVRMYDLLQSYHRDEETADESSGQFDQEFRRVRHTLSERKLVARVEAGADEDSYRLSLDCESSKPKLPEEATITLRPTTLAERNAVSVAFDSDPIASFDVSYAQLTSFIAVTSTIERDGESKTETFVLNVPLENAPPDRSKRLTRSIIRDRERFLQFIALLLGEVDSRFAHQVSQAEWNSRNTRSGNGSWNQFPLLEQLLRVRYEHPGQLERIHELMTDLLEDERKGENDAESGPDRDGVLPEGFRQVFDPIWESLHGKMRNEEDIPGT